MSGACQQPSILLPPRRAPHFFPPPLCLYEQLITNIKACPNRHCTKINQHQKLGFQMYTMPHSSFFAYIWFEGIIHVGVILLATHGLLTGFASFGPPKESSTHTTNPSVTSTTNMQPRRNEGTISKCTHSKRNLMTFTKRPRCCDLQNRQFCSS